MSTPKPFELKDAVRQQVPLLVGLVGASGSGKTWSALELATGIQQVTGGDIAVIDTEARRALHYSDNFKFKHLDFRAPFSSLRYLEAFRYCVDQGAKVIVVDSMSHEHAGEGGMVDFQEEELTRMAGADFQKRERVKMLAWSKPKAARSKLVNGLLQLEANFIFCFRAKSVSKPVKQQGGKTEVVAMGFVPISGDEFVYEMTLNMLLLPKSGGVPTWETELPGEAMAIKLPDQFRALFAKAAPLSKAIGKKLAEWAAGGVAPMPRPLPPADEFAVRYLECNTPDALEALEVERREFWKRWKKGECEKIKAAADRARAALEGGADEDEFGNPLPAPGEG